MHILCIYPIDLSNGSNTSSGRLDLTLKPQCTIVPYLTNNYLRKVNTLLVIFK